MTAPQSANSDSRSLLDRDAAPSIAGGAALFVVHQALYTSAQTERQAGYQLVARSGGISPAIARDMVPWCPTHDSLTAGELRAASFFPLAGDAYGIGYTTLAGAEYSGRRGECVCTRVMVLASNVLAAFEQQPLRVIDAARAEGHLRLKPITSEDLPELQLLALAPWGERAESPTGDKFARLLAAHKQVAVCGAARPLEEARRLLEELPVRLRKTISFSAALRYSARRPFRLLVIGDDEEERRRLRRVPGMALVEVEDLR